MKTKKLEKILKFLQKHGFEDMVELVFRPQYSLHHPFREGCGIDFYEGWYQGYGGYEAVELHIKDYKIVGILVYDHSTGQIWAAWGKIWVIENNKWKLKKASLL
jgi:hypothetical protein